jgi:CheY-like chemotaxis protein
MIFKDSACGGFSTISKGGMSRMARAKVLLASGIHSELQQMQRYLNDLDLSILTAEDGATALQLARQQRPQLIVLDMELPGRSGVECCWQLRSQQESAGMPIVLLTTGQSWDAEVCRAAGCSEIVVKPFDRRGFVNLGRRLLGSIERRKSRAICRALVHCKGSVGSFYGTIEDLGSNGMFVATSQAIPLGETLRLRFCLPWPEAVPLSVEASIAWVNQEGRRRRSLLPEGFGVVFIEPSGQMIEQVERYIEFCEILLPLAPQQGEG